MNQPGVVKNFFAIVFGVIFAGLFVLLIACLFGYNDLDAGKLAIACLVSALISQKLRGEPI